MRSMTRDRAAQVLRVSPNASLEEMERARRQRMKKVHPDRGGSHEEASEANLALEVLQQSTSAATELQATVERMRIQSDLDREERRTCALSKLRTGPVIVTANILSLLTTFLTAAVTLLRTIEAPYLPYVTALPVFTGLWAFVVWYRRALADNARHDMEHCKRQLALWLSTSLETGDSFSPVEEISRFLDGRQGTQRVFEAFIPWLGYSRAEHFSLVADSSVEPGLLDTAGLAEASKSSRRFILRCDLAAERMRISRRHTRLRELRRRSFAGLGAGFWFGSVIVILLSILRGGFPPIWAIGGILGMAMLWGASLDPPRAELPGLGS